MSNIQNHSSADENSITPTVVTAVPVNSHPIVPTIIESSQVYKAPSPAGGAAHRNDTPAIGICRRCRREFVRDPSLHDGQAQYYRCQDCEKERLNDLFMGSCILH